MQWLISNLLHHSL